MDLDDDVPPELVDTAVAAPDEELTIKVPITIVTGMPAFSIVPMRTLLTHEAILRLSRSWKDNAAQLHPHSGAWQEDCRHHEWSELPRCLVLAFADDG